MALAVRVADHQLAAAQRLRRDGRRVGTSEKKAQSDTKDYSQENSKELKVRVARPLLDSVTQHVEDVSERFAHLLHMTLSLAFDDASAKGGASTLVQGQTTSQYVAGIDYRQIVRRLLRFKCCHPQDVTSLFALMLVYLRLMKSRVSLPLLEQMIVWFDVSNVIYCVAFLSHVWLLDDAFPLADWHSLAEGVVKGVNLNKCVRNVLRILKYRLYVTATQSRAALLTLEYVDKRPSQTSMEDAGTLLKNKALSERPPNSARPNTAAEAAAAEQLRVAAVRRMRVRAAESETHSSASEGRDLSRFAPSRR